MSVAGSRSFPVIDVAEIGAYRKSCDLGNDTVADIGSRIKNALGEFGVCYIRNHGIDQEFVDRYLALAKEFFKLPNEIKMQFVRGPKREYGYYPYEQEKLNVNRPGDLKESFNYHPVDDQAEWVNREFHEASRDLFSLCTSLGNNVMDALSLGLGLDKTFLRNAHKYIGEMKNLTSLRTLFYPPVPSDISSIKQGQLRMGEHSDYGTVSLLFQDDVGGLEINMPEHGIVPVTPVSGTIVLIAGELLQRWTCDSVVAVKHMVNIPEEESKRNATRQSAVFFINPDYECIIKPLNGSDKYLPVSCFDFLNAKMQSTLGFGLTY